MAAEKEAKGQPISLSAADGRSAGQADHSTNAEGRPNADMGNVLDAGTTSSTKDQSPPGAKAHTSSFLSDSTIGQRTPTRQQMEQESEDDINAELLALSPNESDQSQVPPTDGKDQAQNALTESQKLRGATSRKERTRKKEQWTQSSESLRKRRRLSPLPKCTMRRIKAWRRARGRGESRTSHDRASSR